MEAVENGEPLEIEECEFCGYGNGVTTHNPEAHIENQVI